MDGYKTETGSIRSDAKIWKEAANDLNAPKSTVRSLTLTAFDIGLIPIGVGLDDTYDQLRQRIGELLDGAQKSFTKLSTTLTKVANDYDKQEADGADHMSDAGTGMEGS